MDEARHMLKAPAGFHQRVTMRVHIASHQDRLTRQLRRAAATVLLALGLMTALGAFSLYHADMADVDEYAPPGLLGHVDYYLASLRVAWSGYQGGYILPIGALLMASTGIITLLWWLGKRGGNLQSNR